MIDILRILKKNVFTHVNVHKLLISNTYEYICLICLYKFNKSIYINNYNEWKEFYFVLKVS